jgi:hypothetical protein
MIYKTEGGVRTLVTRGAGYAYKFEVYQFDELTGARTDIGEFVKYGEDALRHIGDLRVADAVRFGSEYGGGDSGYVDVVLLPSMAHVETLMAAWLRERAVDEHDHSSGGSGCTGCGIELAADAIDPEKP